MSWETEDIPDEDCLYMRVHKGLLANGELRANAFRDQTPPEGISGNYAMSTHWERYCSAKEAREKARVPEDNGIVMLNTGEVRAVPQDVVHTPYDDDRSHTDVIGEKTTEVRLKLFEIAKWAIKVK